MLEAGNVTTSSTLVRSLLSELEAARAQIAAYRALDPSGVNFK